MLQIDQVSLCVSQSDWEGAVAMKTFYEYEKKGGFIHYIKRIYD